MVKYSIKSHKREEVLCGIQEKKDGFCIVFSIGLDLAEVLGINIGDKINVYHHATNPDFYILKKSPDFRGIKSWAPYSTNVLYVNFYLGRGNETKIRSVSVNHEILDDGMIFVDISKMRAAQ